MLIVISGLPGTGKSAVAEHVARALAAVHLSVDTIEDALLGAGLTAGWTSGVAAYEAVRAVAEQNLRIGNTVVVDAVSDSAEARSTWQCAAGATGCRLRWLVLLAPPEPEHRRRLASRVRGFQHLREPSWDDVTARAGSSAPWPAGTPQISTDAALDVVVREALAHLISR